jgi:hypothetical protein
MKINKNVHNVISPTAAPELRLSAALGKAELTPVDMLTAMVILTRDADPEIKKTSIAALKKFPPIELLAALECELDQVVLKIIAKAYKGNQAVLARVITNPAVNDKTLAMIAGNASAFIVELIAELTERLRDSKPIVIAIQGNPETSEDTLERIKEFTDLDDNIDAGGDSEGDDYVEEDYETESLFKSVSRMTVAEKMKLALKGSQEARNLLIKDSNKIVSGSVLKNPKISDEEVIRLTGSTGTPDDLLRQVARRKDWMKVGAIKRNLVTNPKTPLDISMRLVRYLDKRDLERISNSKNIPNTLVSEARKALMLKKKHG